MNTCLFTNEFLEKLDKIPGMDNLLFTYICHDKQTFNNAVIRVCKEMHIKPEYNDGQKK